MQARAFVPGHISTFFVPAGDPSGPLAEQGSLGSGFSIEAGVTTAARAAGPTVALGATPGRRKIKVQVRDNGRPVRAARSTRGTLEALLAGADPTLPVPERLLLSNRYALPLGAGFGVSGACALGAALTANQALGLGLSRAACVAAAHTGEVAALTGLGDVSAQSAGGFEVRTRPGPPPLGEVRGLWAPALPVLLVSFGPRPTSRFLKEPRGKVRLAKVGTRCLEELLKAPSWDLSVRLGRQFAESLGLVSPRASRLLRALGPRAPASVAMLGDSVFAFGGPLSLREARRLFPSAFVTSTKVASIGARLL